MKRLMTIILVTAMIFSALFWVKPITVSAKAMSNASALTPFVYHTGSYTALKKLTVYSSSKGSGSTGKSVAKNKAVSVTSVSGHYGQVKVDGKSGWIDLTYACSTANKVDIPARLNMLREKFPSGMYWNRETTKVNNPDGFTDQPCASGHKDKRDNSFDGTGQCHGFALKLGYDLFGCHAGVWQRHYDLSKVVVGDLIRYGGRHTVMVTGVFDDYFTVAHCNYYYECDISWDDQFERDFFSFDTKKSSDGIYHCPSNTGGNQKYIIATNIPGDFPCQAILMESEDLWYYADGVREGDKVTFTFHVPEGTYPQFCICNEDNETYFQDNFVPGKSRLPDSITLHYYVENIDTYCPDYNITFTVHPQSVTASVGDTVTFSAEAIVEDEWSDLEYRWLYKKKGDKLWSLWKGHNTASTSAIVNESWDGMQVVCFAYDDYYDIAYSQPATITVILVNNDTILGNVNGDGKVNGKDATRLMQYLAGWDVEIDQSAADVNGDGKINGKDATRLMQYLAGWDVTLGK